MRPRGRPPSENTKKIRFELRLTDEDAEILNECAEKLMVSKTAVVQRGIRLVKAEMKK